MRTRFVVFALAVFLPACGGSSSPNAPATAPTPVPTPVPTPRPLFTASGQGNTVFDMPTTVTRIHVVATYTGRSSNFIVRIGGRLVVNELMGTAFNQVTHDAIYLTIGGVVEITNSTGVAWTFTEVR